MKMLRNALNLCRRMLVLTAAALLAPSVMVVNSHAAKPPSIPTWYDGGITHFTVVSENVLGVDHRGLETAAIPLYAFGFPPVQAQFDIIGLAPGDSGYNPWWKVILVIPLSPRDLSSDPYTSEAELLQAHEAGEVALIETEFYFLCQVLPNR